MNDTVNTPEVDDLPAADATTEATTDAPETAAEATAEPKKSRRGKKKDEVPAAGGEGAEPVEAAAPTERRPSFRVSDTSLIRQGPNFANLKRPKYLAIASAFPAATEEPVLVDAGLVKAVAALTEAGNLKSKSWAEDPKKYLRGYLSELIAGGYLVIIQSDEPEGEKTSDTAAEANQTDEGGEAQAGLPEASGDE